MVRGKGGEKGGEGKEKKKKKKKEWRNERLCVRGLEGCDDEEGAKNVRLPNVCRPSGVRTHALHGVPELKSGALDHSAMDPIIVRKSENHVISTMSTVCDTTNRGYFPKQEGLHCTLFCAHTKHNKKEGRDGATQRPAATSALFLSCLPEGSTKETRGEFVFVVAVHFLLLPG